MTAKNRGLLPVVLEKELADKLGFDQSQPGEPPITNVISFVKPVKKWSRVGGEGTI